MSELEIAAPAQADAPATAMDAAVDSRDFSAFRAASLAEREGKPLELPKKEATEAPAPKVETPERQLSKRQQQINDYERRIAEQDAELARLRTATPKTDQPPAPKTTPAPAPEKFESWDTYSTAHPDASYDDYIDARADFRFEQRQQAIQRDQQQAQRAQAVETTQRTFVERMQKLTETDPEFVNGIHPGLLALRPTHALTAGESPTVHNAIADHIMRSDLGPQMLKHFTDHPEDYAEIAALPPQDFFIRMGKLEAALERPQAGASDPKPVSRMAPPATTLGTRASTPVDEEDAAVGSKDFSRFKELQLQKRLATLR